MNSSSAIGVADASKIKLGWAAGTGVDILLPSNVILNLAYLHVGLGNVTATNSFTFY